MPHRSVKVLVEERVAKLEAISNRRNVLLCEMHKIIRRRHDLGSVLRIDDEDEDEAGNLQAFLERFKMPRDNPEAGSIITLSDSELFAPPPREDIDASIRPPSSKGQSSSSRSTRSRQKVDAAPSPVMHAEISILPSPRLGSLVASMDVDEDFGAASGAHTSTAIRYSGDGKDELDLLRSPAGAQSILTETTRRDDALILDVLESMVASPTKNILRQAAPITTMEQGAAVATVPTEKSANGEGQKDALDVSEAGSMDAVSQMEFDASPATTLNPQDLVLSRAVEDAIMADEAATNEFHGDAHSLAPASILLTNHTFLPLVPTHAKRPIIVRSTPSSGAPAASYVFGETPTPQLQPPPPTPTVPLQRQHQFKPEFTLPPLQAIQPEYNNKKSKSGKRKRDGSSKKENAGDWTPLGLNKWAATVNANPVWKRVARASKCLSTREWAIAMSELRLTRAIDRIENLKREGRWSFRQPKKQRAIGGILKTHWDHLIDEMKWMRVDFREERKWKIALAYSLSTAVLDWHAAGTTEIRVAKGICVRWKRPSPVEQDQDMVVDEDANLDDPNADSSADQADMEVDVFEEGHQHQSQNSLLGVDYGSDDDDDGEDDDDDKTKDSQDVVDALEPSTLIEDALDDANKREESLSQDIQPKTEEMEDNSALVNSMPIAEPQGIEGTTGVDEMKPEVPSGLKTTSNDPVLLAQPTPSSNSGDNDPSTTSASKSLAKTNIYAPFREIVAYSEDDKLFIDLDEFDMSMVGAPGSIPHDAPVPPPDLSSIFPDLPVLTLFDPPPVIQPAPEGKKRSEKRADRDDPSRRPDDILYTRLYPTGDFMMIKPTLIGSLCPSKNWKNGQWLALDETAVAPEPDVVIKVLDDNVSELFDSRSSSAPSVIIANQIQTAILKDKDNRKGSSDHLWSNADDGLLKTFVDKYPNNWALIAECFNASRLTISTDKRTFRDCIDRWREKWGPELLRRPLDTPSMVDATPPPNSSQMTTRGVKRLASASVSSQTPAGVPTGSESRKRRRHAFVQDTIRKAGKKRADALQKMQAAQRKPPAIHETHAQYAKLPKRTPAELSRVKAEKEQREQAEMLQARKRQEEINRQNIMSRMIATGAVPAQAMQQQQQQQQPQQQQQLVAATTQRPTTASIPAPTQVVPAIRSQVNISQQQRTNTPSLQNAPRLAQQMLQAQAQQAQVRAAQHQQNPVPALAQTQNQIQMNSAATTSNAHLSSSYGTRDVTSSPAHVSPLLNSAVPSTANSPRPPSAQAHALLQAAQVPGNAGTRGGYYLPNVPSVQGYTTEQIHTALRLQHHAQAAQQQLQQQQQQQQQGFPSQS